VSLIAAEISDGRVLHLIRSFLDAGVIEAGKWHPTTTGVPQGGVASPLWSNIFLTPFDRAMTEAGYRLTRWADDFVVVCKTRQEAEAALALADRAGIGDRHAMPVAGRAAALDHEEALLGADLAGAVARPAPRRLGSTA